MEDSIYFCGIKLSPPSKEEREELEQRVIKARKERKAEYDGNGIPNSVFIQRRNTQSRFINLKKT